MVLGIAFTLLFAATANQMTGGVPTADATADLQVKLAVGMGDPDATAATRAELLGGEGAAPLRAVTLVAEGLGTEQAR